MHPVTGCAVAPFGCSVAWRAVSPVRCTVARVRRTVSRVWGRIALMAWHRVLLMAWGRVALMRRPVGGTARQEFPPRRGAGLVTEESRRVGVGQQVHVA